MKKSTKSTKATSTKSTKNNGNGEQKKQRKARPANDNFRVSDPKALLKAEPKALQETVADLAADKTLKKSQLTGLGQRIAYRLALLGVIAADTLARNAKDRTYKVKGRLTMATVKAAMAKAQ